MIGLGHLRTLLVVYRCGVGWDRDWAFRVELLAPLSHRGIWAVVVGINVRESLLRGVVDAHGRRVHREGSIFSQGVLHDGSHIRERKVWG